MARTPNQGRFRIDPNAVGCSPQIARSNLFQDFQDRATGRIDHLRVDIFTDRRGKLLANDSVPQRGVAGVAVRSILAVDDIWNCAALGKSAKSKQQFADFFPHSCRQKPARANQRVASPIQKPRVTCDDGFALIAPNHVGLDGQRQFTPEGVIRRKICPRTGQFIAGDALGIKLHQIRGTWIIGFGGTHQGHR